MICYIVLLLFIILFGKVDHWNDSNTKRKKYLMITFAVIIVLAAMRSWTVGIDLRNQYAKAYQTIANMSWSAWEIFDMNGAILLIVKHYLI